MRFCLPWINARTPLWLLPMTFALGGCLSIPTALRGETEAGVVLTACRALPLVTYSSKDTEQTRREAEAAYRARLAFGCPK